MRPLDALGATIPRVSDNPALTQRLRAHKPFQHVLINCFAHGPPYSVVILYASVLAGV